MALVRQLEAQVDSENGGGPEAGVPSGEGLGPAGEGQREATAAGWGTLPTGDELAAEVERFLKGEQG